MSQPTGYKKAIATANQWLWSNRKILIATIGSVGILELMFSFPAYLYLWLVGLFLYLAVSCWWVTNMQITSRKLWILMAELIWASAAVVGFIVFNLVSQFQFQATCLIVAGVWFGLFKIFEHYALTGSWPVRSLPVMDFVDLLSFFFAGAALMMAGDFYSLPVHWIVVGFAVQTIFGLTLRFLREDLDGIRKWLYVLVAVLMTEEIVWVASFWHRGVFLKTFFVSVIFYLMADLIVHYNRGQLTVKVAMEYVGLAVAVLVGVLIVDGFLVLR